MNRVLNTVCYALLLACTFIFASCEKPEGEGGNATIKGKVWVENWNNTFTVKLSEYAGADAEVYIIYGSQTGVGDRIRANYNGEYEFKYLREGNYKVYVYSKDTSLQSPSGQVAMIKEVKITSNNQTVDVPQITIYE